MFMINLRGLIILSLFLLGDARRSFRIEDSRHYAQQQNKMLTKDFEVSADGKDALIPTGLRKTLFTKAKRLLPQGDAPPRFPSATMNLGYGRGSPGYDSWYGDSADERWYDVGSLRGRYGDGWGDEWEERRWDGWEPSGDEWGRHRSLGRMSGLAGSPRGRRRWGRSWDRRGIASDMGGYGRYGGNMGGYDNYGRRAYDMDGWRR